VRLKNDDCQLSHNEPQVISFSSTVCAKVQEYEVDNEAHLLDDCLETRYLEQGLRQRGQCSH